MTTRHLRSTLTASLAILLSVIVSLPACAQQTGFADAVGLMKREQTLGEANAGLLKTFAKGDTATFARGIRLYAQARADFNALIETLKATLNTQGELSDSQAYADDLQRAAKQRVAFTDFVDEKILSQSEEGAKSLASVIGGADAISGVAELITSLKDAGLDIWREYKAADKEQRTQILDQLDSLLWRSFGEVPALG